MKQSETHAPLAQTTPAPQLVPLGSELSAGQDPLEPVHTPGASQEPAEARHV